MEQEQSKQQEEQSLLNESVQKGGGGSLLENLNSWRKQNGLIEPEAQQKEEDKKEQTPPEKELPRPDDLWEQFAASFAEYGEVIIPAEIETSIGQLSGKATIEEVAQFYYDRVYGLEEFVFGLSSSESEYQLALTGLDIQVNDATMEEAEQNADYPTLLDSSLTVGKYGFIEAATASVPQLELGSNGTVTNPGIGEREGDAIKVLVTHPETGQAYMIRVFMRFQIYNIANDKD